MAWIGALASVAGGLMASHSANKAAKDMKYQPWNTRLYGIGQASFNNGHLSLTPNGRSAAILGLLDPLQNQALGQYAQGQQNALGQDFLRGAFGQSELGSAGGYSALANAVNGNTPYQSQDFLSGVDSGLLGNFDPNEAAQNYTNLLRQQAQPQEQQAAASALNNLFGSGRLGTTGGQNAYQTLIDSQNQADIQRQIAGQQYGLQQQLMAQQGLDQARANQQGLMLNNFMANQQGLNSQFNRDQGMFQRNLDLFNAGSSTTQDRFNRALQLFGGENALNQQNLANFTGLLGAQQGIYNQVLDVGRLGASVGQSQTAANANAAMLRNQANQDLISGFLQAASAYSNRNKDD